MASTRRHADTSAEPEQVDDNDGEGRIPSDVFVPDRSLPHAFNFVANRVSATLERMYSQRFGLSVVGWRIVAILGTHSPLSAKALAERTAMDQVSVSRTVEQLTRKRLVSRRVDPVDRRRVVLRLSKRGREVYNQIVPVLFASENALISVLSDEDVAHLRRIMATLIDRSVEVLGDDCDWRELVAVYGYGYSAEDEAETEAEVEAGSSGNIESHADEVD